MSQCMSVRACAWLCACVRECMSLSVCVCVPYLVELDRLVQQHHQQRGQRPQQPGQHGDRAQVKGQGAGPVSPQLVVHCSLNQLTQQTGQREGGRREGGRE